MSAARQFPSTVPRPWTLAVPGRSVIKLQEAKPSTAGCVIAVDDQPVFRSAVHSLIAAAPSLVLVGEADSGEAAVELVRELRPDLVLMDVYMPGIGGIAAARAIKAIDQSIVVVLTSTTHPDELPQEAHSLGDRIVWKGELRPRLLEEIWRRHRDGKGEDSLPSS